MTRKQIAYGVVANVVFWSFVAFVVVTHGWAMVGFAVLLVVFALFAVGVGAAGR